MALLVIGIIPTMAQAAPQLNPTSVSSSVSDFRQSIATVLNSYFLTYGSRLSLAEQAQMSTLMKQVDQELSVLQRKTQASAKLAQQHAAKAKQKDAARAKTAIAQALRESHL